MSAADTFRGIPIRPASLWGMPGLYTDIPANAYHASHDMLSRSLLKHLSRSPAHCKAALDGLLDKEPTPALTFGTLFHGVVLEGKSLDDMGMVARPEGLSLVTKEGRAWKEANLGKVFVTAEEVAKVSAMRAAVQAHPKARAMLTGRGLYEASIAVPDPWGLGVTLRVRPDFLPEKGSSIIDAKTCMDASPGTFSREAWNFGYFVQAAFYLFVAELAGLDYQHFSFVAVEKEAPFAVEIYYVEKGDAEYERAIREIEFLVRRFARCQSADEWPSYTSGDVTQLIAPRFGAYSSEIEEEGK